MARLTHRSVAIGTAFVIGAIWSPLLMRSETALGVIAAIVLGAAIMFMLVARDAEDK